MHSHLQPEPSVAVHIEFSEVGGEGPEAIHLDSITQSLQQDDSSLAVDTLPRFSTTSLESSPLLSPSSAHTAIDKRKGKPQRERASSKQFTEFDFYENVSVAWKGTSMEQAC